MFQLHYFSPLDWIGTWVLEWMNTWIHSLVAAFLWTILSTCPTTFTGRGCNYLICLSSTGKSISIHRLFSRVACLLPPPASHIHNPRCSSYASYTIYVCALIICCTRLAWHVANSLGSIINVTGFVRITVSSVHFCSCPCPCCPLLSTVAL